MLEKCFIGEQEKRTAQNLTENGKETRQVYTPIQVQTHTHTLPPISTHSLLFSALSPPSASNLLLPVLRIVSGGHIMSSLSLSVCLSL
ncbi:hypothetical protein EXN66_Car019912 [Channa argus]|uniref:Uncharacterized protein n=1 Tax=Channa argus TaxID=215402 RepID=A0A6G1QPK1_CHAAH|nr:hypothetical protein EXN66_Car019912 [Channa argus]